MQATRGRPADSVWDCHTHIYGPWEQFPVPADAAYRPEAAPMSSLLALHERLGITRGVIVQAACYRHDHSALLAAIAATGGTYRGVALVDDTIDDGTLRALHAGGVRGIRFNFMGHLPGERDTDKLLRTAERVAALGWHVLLHGRLADLLPVLDQWAGADIPMVIDHMARPSLQTPWTDDQRDALLAHLGNPHRWIKLSGVDRFAGGDGCAWPDARPLARRLLDAAPDRAIWGTDWPHPNIEGAVPDDLALLTFVRDLCSDDALARAVLTDNPLRLYG
ncbi:amidohydrolase family protein [Burkholderia multivorans]|uniref:amidohydrolase family protein n=1 Tax=Burkholderia multivorans TaxID=87883 RepID=UPI001C21897A|nr:amidohydrolase family protein [Burkholderia multivorans]MBU9222178.1 amidohydrolase family protein [Burkholderia multivorans]MBU9417762.1 amidohydrolase family protein [Burkholderia multivorans]MBU9476738.1 amidohydrolase family protein [Burkholderia multivorans]